MIHLVKIKSKDNLKKVLKHLKGRIESAQFLIASEIIRRKDLPKNALVLNYSFLIPSPIMITMYASEGRSADYEDEYQRLLTHTATVYFINEAILTSMSMELDLFIVCAIDEEEYGYVDMTCDFIEDHYGVKPMSVKKYLAGKETIGMNEGLYYRALKYKEVYGKKLKDSYLDVNRMFEGLIYEEDVKKLMKRK